MASIERTAYPGLKNHISPYELETSFTPTIDEISFAKSFVKEASALLTFLIHLKCFQCLCYFPLKKEIPKSIVDHIRSELNLPKRIKFKTSAKALVRYKIAIREHLGFKAYRAKGEKILISSMEKISLIRNDPVDLINVAIQELLTNSIELPAFSTLNRLAFKIRNNVHNKLFTKVTRKLKKTNKDFFKSLLKSENEYNRTPYNRLKELPKSPTLKHLEEWLEHLDWIKSLGSTTEYLKGLTINKINLFAEEARVLDASEIKSLAKPKQYTLILCLIHSTLNQTVDNLIEMFLKRMKIIHRSANDRLKEIREENISLNEKLIDVLESILYSYEYEKTGQSSKSIKAIIKDNGGTKKLMEECAKVNAYKNNNYLPLLWQFYKRHRSSLFKVIKSITTGSTTEDNSLIEAVDYLIQCQNKRSKHINASVSLDFASTRWKKLVCVKVKNKEKFDRRYFELCVFSYLADELRSGDVYVDESSEFSDYRKELLSWEECLKKLNKYCENTKLPQTPDDFVQREFDELNEITRLVDESYPAIDQLDISENGEVKLKRYQKKQTNPEAIKLAQLIEKKMPERKLLDILCNSEYWTNWTRHYSPVSGSDNKLSDPRKNYILTTFAYGSNMGPNQLARHMKDMTAHPLSYANRKHVTTEKLNKANTDIINIYNRFSLPKLWGNENVVAADGTHIKIYEDNLLAEYHIRYGAYGGVAYHHVSDNYVALFSNFIACGVWEAVYILDALLENKSDLKPDTIHADTQGQSTPVFALSQLLGINLMPRIRNWKDITIYRPTAETKYENINPLFGEAINWDIIRTHWKDMVQVAISVQEGVITSSTLLRKLGNYSKKNKLYKAFQELGRVRKTIFLLKYISDPNLPRIITAASNKVENYHGFTEQLRFGAYGVLRSNNPVELEKMIKYNSIIANSVILQNVVDMTNIINDLINSGVKISLEDLELLNPYLTFSIKRFGEYSIDLSIVPPPLNELIKLSINN